jgi:signal transduction histidine kinase
LLSRADDVQLAIRWGFAAIFLVNALLILAGAATVIRDDMHRHRAELVRVDEHTAALAAEVSQRAEELRALSAHLIEVQENERHTIARELHDELGGTLSAVKMDILMGRDAASKRGDEKSVARLQRALTSIDSGVQFTRRLIEDLRPTLLDNLGFEAALRSMTEQFSERCSVTCAIALPEGELNLSSAQSTALYRICQEALTNVMKYAKATEVTIALTTDGALWRLVLADDGVGLDTTKRDRSISHGLLGMRERIVALGGTFDISGPAGCGTTLTAAFPVVAREEVVA